MKRPIRQLFVLSSLRNLNFNSSYLVDPASVMATMSATPALVPNCLRCGLLSIQIIRPILSILMEYTRGLLSKLSHLWEAKFGLYINILWRIYIYRVFFHMWFNNSSMFWATYYWFVMEVCMDCPNNLQFFM